MTTYHRMQDMSNEEAQAVIDRWYSCLPFHPAGDRWDVTHADWREFNMALAKVMLPTAFREFEGHPLRIIC